MIIPDSVMEAVNRSRRLFSAFQKQFDPLLESIAAKHKGIYEARPEKTAESIVDKIQLFRGTKPLSELYDLSAGTIIVPTLDLVSKVASDVNEAFIVVRDSRIESGNPENFGYDDTHLVLQLRDGPSLVNKRLLGLSFELQIKTYLQFAWARVVHDFVYKAQEVSWPKARMASEIRAMLELADQALAQPESAAALLPATQFPDYDRLNRFIMILRQNWPGERLPANLRRAAYSIRALVEAAGISSEELGTLLMKQEYDPLKATLQITPVQGIFIVLFREKGIAFIRKLKSRVLITAEMELFHPELRQVPADRRVVLDTPSDE
ncbi:MAG: hypothetical protein ACOY94_07470 [Bacillota bacterium]